MRKNSLCTCRFIHTCHGLLELSICVYKWLVYLWGVFFYTSLFSLFGVFIHRITLWRESDVVENLLVLLVLIGSQTVPYLKQLFIPFLKRISLLQFYIKWLFPKSYWSSNANSNEKCISIFFYFLAIIKFTVSLSRPTTVI